MGLLWYNVSILMGFEFGGYDCVVLLLLGVFMVLVLRLRDLVYLWLTCDLLPISFWCGLGIIQLLVYVFSIVVALICGVGLGVWVIWLWCDLVRIFGLGVSVVLVVFGIGLDDCVVMWLCGLGVFLVWVSVCLGGFGWLVCLCVWWFPWLSACVWVGIIQLLVYDAGIGSWSNLWCGFVGLVGNCGFECGGFWLGHEFGLIL